MFETLEPAPPDPILGLGEAFKSETNPDKINLGVGVFKDEAGKTPTLEVVRRAEALLLEANASKTYLPMSGSPDYAEAVKRLVLGADSPIVRDGRARTAQTPGGTGALRVAADFIHQNAPSAKVWVSDPTWANHQGIFKAAGVETAVYPYYDFEKKTLAFEAMIETLSKVPKGDIVLFHACCHNPSGMDPQAEQWQKVSELCPKRGFFPFFDFAYQGFGDGIEEDAHGLRKVVGAVPEALIANSFSKNFGLYNERVGGLTLISPDAKAATAGFSHLTLAIRTNYSNPPVHGAAIVATVLGDQALRAAWEQELAAMRTRIAEMRRLFVAELSKRGVSQDFSFIETQKGMFSFSGLSREQVAKFLFQSSLQEFAKEMMIAEPAPVCVERKDE
jgi:aspartate aminotransferase/aromatic-amino-acid transaminase